MKILKIPIYIGISVLLFIGLALPSLAVTTFQVYTPGVAGDYGPDQDTWFTTNNPFDILVAGAYGPQTTSLTNVVLLISIPDGETGTITVTGTGGTVTPTLMTLAGVYVPSVGATADIIGPATGYYDKSFLPDSPVKANFNNHYPLQDSTSDFLLFDLGSFSDLGTPINDWNADGGTITPTGQTGEIKTYSISSSGFPWLHGDVFGLEEDLLGGKKIKYSWDISPGSHDITFIPAPGAVLLGSIGISFVGWLRRRRTL